MYNIFLAPSFVDTLLLDTKILLTFFQNISHVHTFSADTGRIDEETSVHLTKVLEVMSSGTVI